MELPRYPENEINMRWEGAIISIRKDGQEYRLPCIVVRESGIDEIKIIMTEQNTKLHVFTYSGPEGNHSKYNHVAVETEEAGVWEAYGQIYGTKLWDDLVSIDIPFVVKHKVDQATREWYEEYYVEIEEGDVITEAQLGTRSLEKYLMQVGEIADNLRDIQE